MLQNSPYVGSRYITHPKFTDVFIEVMNYKGTTSGHRRVIVDIMWWHRHGWPIQRENNKLIPMKAWSEMLPYRPRGVR
jgi:hypothetical protein